MCLLMAFGSRIECHASKNNLLDHREQRSMILLQVAKSRLEVDPIISERTKMSVDSIMNLLEFVLDNNYFIVDGTFYKQIFGCPMNSPVNAILANLVMENIEDRVSITAPHPPKWWYRYVDDSVCIAREHQLTDFHSHLNLN